MNWFLFIFFSCLILFLIGLIKIKLFLCFKEEFGYIALKILFFKFSLFSTEKSNSKRSVLKETSKKTKSKNQKIDKNKKKSKKKQSLSEKIDLFFLILKPTFGLLEFLNRGFQIKKIRLNLQIAGEDACKTAVMYGRFCCYFVGFHLFLETFIVKLIKKNSEQGGGALGGYSKGESAKAP